MVRAVRTNVARLLALITRAFVLMLLIQPRSSHVGTTRHFDFFPIGAAIVQMHQVVHLIEQHDVLLFRRADRSLCARVIHHRGIVRNILGTQVIPDDRGADIQR